MTAQEKADLLEDFLNDKGLYWEFINFIEDKGFDENDLNIEYEY